MAESVERDREESQGIACASISSPSQHNEKQPSATFSETLVFSDFLATNGCSCEPVSSSNAITAKSNNLFSLDKPNHPNISVISAQKLLKRTLYFQCKWYEDYEWIHNDSDLKKVLCFYYSKASAMGVTDLAHPKDPAFITQGFKTTEAILELH